MTFTIIFKCKKSFVHKNPGLCCSLNSKLSLKENTRKVLSSVKGVVAVWRPQKKLPTKLFHFVGFKYQCQPESLIEVLHFNKFVQFKSSNTLMSCDAKNICSAWNVSSKKLISTNKKRNLIIATLKTGKWKCEGSSHHPTPGSSRCHIFLQIKWLLLILSHRGKKT